MKDLSRECITTNMVTLSNAVELGSQTIMKMTKDGSFGGTLDGAPYNKAAIARLMATAIINNLMEERTDAY